MVSNVRTFFRERRSGLSTCAIVGLCLVKIYSITHDEGRYLGDFRPTSVCYDVERESMGANFDTLVDKYEKGKILEVQGGLQGSKRFSE